MTTSSDMAHDVRRMMTTDAGAIETGWNAAPGRGVEYEHTAHPSCGHWSRPHDDANRLRAGFRCRIACAAR
ncbi:hypothetical protein GGR69_001344 [Xanthomonas arboricola]|nr:hypothetical protein [Xanthomonas arboricola]